MQAGWIRGVERIGGFGGKADALAECAVYTGDPGCFRDSLKTLAAASVDNVRAAGNTWLGAGRAATPWWSRRASARCWPRNRR